MSLIFVGSSDTQSFPRSSRIVEPILRWLFPKVSDQTVHNVVFVARKGAHLTEYAILAMLIWRAVRMPTRGDRRPWLWKHFWIALGIAAFYASTDEIHQLYVPGREGRVHDVIIDTCGSAAGLLFIRQVGRWRKRW